MIIGEDKFWKSLQEVGISSPGNKGTAVYENSSERTVSSGIPGEDQFWETLGKDKISRPRESADERFQRDRTERILSESRRKGAQDWLNQYNAFLDDVNKTGSTRQNVSTFNSLRKQYDQHSSLFNADANKRISDSLYSMKEFFDSRQGKLPTDEWYLPDRKELDKMVSSYEKTLSQLRSRMEEYDADPDASQADMVSLMDEIDSVNSALDDVKTMYDDAVSSEKRYNAKDHRSGKFEYDPKYDSSIPFRGRGGGGIEAPEVSSFSEYTTNRTAREMSEKGWNQFQEDDAAKEADRQAAREL